MPPELKKAKTGTVEFGARGIHGHLRVMRSICGRPSWDTKSRRPTSMIRTLEHKFPKGWHDRLAKAFDKYLEADQPKELNTGSTLCGLYRAWRDECKVGFNRVDVEKLVQWLEQDTEPPAGVT